MLGDNNFYFSKTEMLLKLFSQSEKFLKILRNNKLKNKNKKICFFYLRFDFFFLGQ
jgi:hypothetical protein